MFIGYEMFRNLASGKIRKSTTKTREELVKYLLDPGKYTKHV